MHMRTGQQKPPFAWMGGKRHLFKELYSRWPKGFDNYVEPFIGGGFVFLNQPNRSEVKTQEISDISIHIVRAYKFIQRDPELLVSRLKEIMPTRGKSFFMKTRKNFNKQKASDEDLTVWFLYLNHLAWGGIVNFKKDGKMHASYNALKGLNSFDFDNLFKVSEKLKGVKILQRNFVNSELEKRKGKTFYYLDPPYHLTHGNYDKEGFDVIDQVKLAAICKRIDLAGDLFMLSNSSTDRLKALYKNFNLEEIVSKRQLDEKLGKKVPKEIIVRNYNCEQD